MLKFLKMRLLNNKHKPCSNDKFREIISSDCAKFLVHKYVRPKYGDMTN